MIWLLLASLAQAQDISTVPVSVPLEMQMEVSNQGKDIRQLRNGRNRYAQPQTFAGGVCFSDGTCQVSASSSTVDVSSFTPVTAGNTTQASFIVAYATVTKTVAAVPLEVCLNGTFSNSTSNLNCWSVLVDGGFVQGLTNSKGISCAASPGVNYAIPINGCFQLSALSAGSHTFAVTFKTNAGTMSWPAQDSPNDVVGTQFGVRERH